MNANTNGAHPVKPTAEPRDVAFERSWTASAAAHAQVPGTALNEFADLRAGTGPVRDLLTRDFVREVLEELADARNYLVWAAQQNTRLVKDDETTGLVNEALGQALQAVATGFHHAARAHELTIDHRRHRPIT